MDNGSCVAASKQSQGQTVKLSWSESTVVLHLQDCPGEKGSFGRNSAVKSSASIGAQKSWGLGFTTGCLWLVCAWISSELSNANGFSKQRLDFSGCKETRAKLAGQFCSCNSETNDQAATLIPASYINYSGYCGMASRFRKLRTKYHLQEWTSGKCYHSMDLTFITEIILYLSLQASAQPANTMLPGQWQMITGVTHTHFLLLGNEGRTGTCNSGSPAFPKGLEESMYVQNKTPPKQPQKTTHHPKPNKPHHRYIGP